MNRSPIVVAAVSFILHGILATPAGNSVTLEFALCLSGPVVPIEEECDWADGDNDGHVDLYDFAMLQNFWKCALPEGCG